MIKFIIRFAIPLLFGFALITLIATPIIDKLTLRWFTKDIELRSDLIFKTLHDSLIDFLDNSQKKKIETLFKKAIEDERLLALGVCLKNEIFFVKTPSMPADIKCLFQDYVLESEVNGGKVFISSKGLFDSETKVFKGQVILVHDLSFIGKRTELTRKYLLYLCTTIALFTLILAGLITKLSLWGWTKTFKGLLKGNFLDLPDIQKTPSEFRPFIKDIRDLVSEIEKEKQFRDEMRLSWTPKTLKEILKKELSGDEVLIVSNREPYIHNKNTATKEIEIQYPASGVVTALEPVMKACSGTWIAHGSGNADKQFVDKNDSLRVPPDHPQYKLRRVWLTSEEEQGYYYGFANEGLWPLCHMAHVRPIFRAKDWDFYVKVQKKFCTAIREEAKTKNPVILIQDYHFALLPEMIKKELPDATIITFWHIPWPNAELFGICPWREEILTGLLGSSILGFHTQYHCNNFIDTVDRYLECRIDRSASIISFQKKTTAVHSYPISISDEKEVSKTTETHFATKEELRKHYGIDENVALGIGVDRLDYTKGILERFYAIERFFEKNQTWIGKFSFMQIAAPSRDQIAEYKKFSNDVSNLVEKINIKYAKGNWKPIYYFPKHHSKAQIFKLFHFCDLCFVSSLHDGMNLVAKEFLSQKTDHTGVLILSQFAGAAMELPEAIIVNPYDIELCADALLVALTMPIEEQNQRMKSLRNYVKEFNVYRWAGRMLMDSARMRRRDKVIKTKI